jgi:hypothetical protein
VAADRRVDPFGLCGLCADGVVEGQGTVEDAVCDLAPIGHFAQSSGVEGGGNLRCDRLHGGENADLRRCNAEYAAQINGILNDVPLNLKRRKDVDGRVGHHEHFWIGRDIHDKGVTDSSGGPHSRRG